MTCGTSPGVAAGSRVDRAPPPRWWTPAHGPCVRVRGGGTPRGGWGACHGFPLSVRADRGARGAPAEGRGVVSRDGHVPSVQTLSAEISIEGSVGWATLLRRPVYPESLTLTPHRSSLVVSRLYQIGGGGFEPRGRLVVRSPRGETTE